jgi:hypothetical protein
VQNPFALLSQISKALEVIDQRTLSIQDDVRRSYLLTKRRLEKVAIDLTSLQDGVTATTDAENSAITLLNNLSAQIADLAANATTPEDRAAIQAFADQLSGGASDLAAAVVANTH